MGMLSGLKAIFSNGVANNGVDNLGRYDNLNEFHTSLNSEGKSALRNGEKAVERIENENPTVSKYGKTSVVENTVQTKSPKVNVPQKQVEEIERD